MSKSVGVFSGTFDPVHIGHVEACIVAKEVCGLNKVLLMLENKPHRKQKVDASADQREQMLSLAVDEYPSLIVPSITSDNITTSLCLDYLKGHYPNSEYWYIFGDDIIKHLMNWPDAEKLLDEFSLCVVLRDNKNRQVVEAQLEKLPNRQKRKRIVLPAVYSTVSSSIAKRSYQDAKEYLDPQVVRYMSDNELYFYDKTSSK